MRVQHFAVVWILSLLVSPLIPSAAAGECNVVFPDGSTAAWLVVVSKTPYPYPPNCRVDPGVDTLVVRVNAIPFERIRFTLPDPPFGTIVGEHWYFPHTGDRLSGLELAPGVCTTTGELGEIYVSADYNVVNPNICLRWTSGTAQIQNCTGRWLPAAFMGQYLGGATAFLCDCLLCWQCSYDTQPYDLYPPDGATNVPLNTVLTWKGTEGVPNCKLFISSDPTCATFHEFTIQQCSSFNPGLLSPNTTYYWRPRWYVDDGWGTGAVAAVHSFTTAGPLSAKTSTWGKIKSMYRN